MKIRITTLQPILRQLAKVKDNKSFYPAHKCVMFAPEADRVTMSTTDGQRLLKITMPLCDHVDPDAQPMLLKTDTLKSLVDMLSCETITLSTEVRGETIDCLLQMDDDDQRIQFPTFAPHKEAYRTLLMGDDPIEFSMTAEVLWWGLNSTFRNMGGRNSRVVFCGVLINIKDHTLDFVGFDGLRLGRYRVPASMGIKPCHINIPAASVRDLLVLLKSADRDVPLRIRVDDYGVVRRIEFAINSDCTYTTGTLPEPYPDYDSALPADLGEATGLTRVSLLTEDLLIAARRMAKIACTTRTAVTLTQKNNKGTLSNWTAGESDAKSSLPVDMMGGDFQVTFTLAYLLDALRSHKPRVLHLCHRDNKSKRGRGPVVYFTDDEGSDTGLLQAVAQIVGSN